MAKIPTVHVNLECIVTQGSPNLYLDQPIIKGWCQPIVGHISYPTDTHQVRTVEQSSLRPHHVTVIRDEDAHQPSIPGCYGNRSWDPTCHSGHLPNDSTDCTAGKTSNERHAKMLFFYLFHYKMCKTRRSQAHHLNVKLLFYQYKKYHIKKEGLPYLYQGLSYLYHGNSYTGKITYLCWNRDQDISSHTIGYVSLKLWMFQCQGY